jgi:Rps23 Pro-64 3,4-dihydroxylase Tpa1-like proline 4-hydroxylase
LKDDAKAKAANQPGLFSTDDDDDDEDDDDDDDEDESEEVDEEEVSEDISDARFAAAKINPDGSVSVPHLKVKESNTKSTGTDAKTNLKVTKAVIREWLGDWIFSDETKAAVRMAFRNKVTYEIKPFLTDDKAELLYQSIKRISDDGHMSLFKGYSKSFQFHHHNLYQTQHPMYNEDPTLRALHDVMDSQYVRDWFADVSGFTINVKTTSTISHYKPGDYSMLHHDSALGPDNGWRKVAFVLHMSKEWDPIYGGDLIYLNPLKLIHAQFNNMVLFKVVEGESWHIVSPVAEHTPSHMQRFAYSGWWNGPRYESN